MLKRTTGRTCLGFGAALHLIKPLGFDIDSTRVKRAGLDYWPHVDLTVHDSVESFAAETMPKFDEVILFSKAGRHGLMDLTKYRVPTSAANVALVFGNETSGIEQVPPHIFANCKAVYLPMDPRIRSFNLANTVSIGLFEVYRQLAQGP